MLQRNNVVTLRIAGSCNFIPLQHFYDWGELCLRDFFWNSRHNPQPHTPHPNFKPIISVSGFSTSSPTPHPNKRKVYKMILSLSCSVTLSYSLSHSFSCAGFYKFVVRDDVISPAGVRNFGTYDDVFEHVHSVARVRKNWATVVANKSGCANGPEAP